MKKQEKLALVESALEAFYGDQQFASSLRESVLYSIHAGGKRIRPFLLLEVLEALQVAIKPAHAQVAAALEMIHTGSLIHDDLPAMDDDDYRRGRLTNHKKFGEAMAILAGDALFLDPYALIAQADLPSQIKVDLIANLSLASGSLGMVAGQVLDMEGEHQHLSLKELQTIHANKTGKLLAYPFQAAAIIAELPPEMQAKLKTVGELIGQEASKMLNIPFGILDLSLAPTPAVGDSVARILEAMGLSVCGTHGTTAALALLNDAVKKGGMMASSAVGGLSGAFIPVSEDEGMIAAAESGVLTLDKLEAMTAVCSVGLDMIAVPGYTPAHTISGIIADEAAIGMINSKTTAVRIIPVTGKTVGESVEFGGLLGYAPIMPVKEGSCEVFVNRGGRIPAPVQSMKN